jgi:hypothetical protein
MYCMLFIHIKIYQAIKTHQIGKERVSFYNNVEMTKLFLWKNTSQLQNFAIP